MKNLFDSLSARTSKMVTRSYSTSFSLGISLLSNRFHEPIYAIYGFVRFADEIVDTFDGFPKEDLLKRFWEETYLAIEQKISLNPILNSFQKTVHQYDIDKELIDTFMRSMAMDLDKTKYDQNGYEEYILGSAEVVGLMCLKVFVEGNKMLYKELQPQAMALGSAFQKINFLRDLNADYANLGRTYFPGVDLKNFSEEERKAIEEDINQDFQNGFEGIKGLPKTSRFGVYVAYVYYYQLFSKIQQTPTHVLLNQRVRIPNNKKYRLILGSYLRHSFNML